MISWRPRLQYLKCKRRPSYTNGDKGKAKITKMSTDSTTPVEEWLTVGRLDASLALLTTKNHHVIEFPTMLLPDNVKAGSIVRIQVSEDHDLEQQEFEKFQSLQNEILEKYGTRRPQSPVLKSINVTQTSGVLGWEPIELGSAQLKSLVLYKDGVRSLMIPNPFKTTATKISGLSVDSQYTFQLKLSTTSGDLWSDKVVLQTHKMTDMSGITACLGALEGIEGITKRHIESSLQNIGAKPLQSHVTIDTTHFITNDNDNEDAELQKAKQSNIPVVRPEWVRACELERRIVGVRGFYLDADASNLESYKFLKLPSLNEAANGENKVKEPPEISREANTPAPSIGAQGSLSAVSTGISNTAVKSDAEVISAVPSATVEQPQIAEEPEASNIVEKLEDVPQEAGDPASDGNSPTLTSEIPNTEDVAGDEQLNETQETVSLTQQPAIQETAVDSAVDVGGTPEVEEPIVDQKEEASASEPDIVPDSNGREVPLQINSSETITTPEGSSTAHKVEVAEDILSTNSATANAAEDVVPTNTDPVDPSSTAEPSEKNEESDHAEETAQTEGLGPTDKANETPESLEKDLIAEVSEMHDLPLQAESPKAVPAETDTLPENPQEAVNDEANENEVDDDDDDEKAIESTPEAGESTIPDTTNGNTPSSSKKKKKKSKKKNKK
ncbi:LADA_0H11342g1_1 [Lachancea dasiensis]|uniref:Chitin biosynthesis protein CHS5 n=1 Tax=Lachancea dasiensis TaxID=1072105 RepID=A0A1G4K3H5_9SACH|nr:LADA_0H11342g1_1 [Lachancea dasiensis]